MTVLTKAQAKLLATIALDDDGIEIAAAPRRTIDALLSHALVARREEPEIGSRFVATARGRELLEAQTPPPPRGSKIETFIALMRRPDGATVAELQIASGWQPHSVRGVISGTIKKKLGYAVSVTKADGARRYHVESPIA